MIDHDRRQQSARAAIVAKHAQQQVADHCEEPVLEPLRETARQLCAGRPLDEVEARRRLLVAPLTIDEARQFVRGVWSVERPGETPVQLFRLEHLDPATRAANFSPDFAAEARWAAPYADQFGLPRSGELAGTIGPVPYIDLTDEALNQFCLLHEITHLLVDSETILQGHNDIWSSEFERVLAIHADPFTATEWGAMLQWAREWAERKIAADPQWPLSMLD